MKLLLATLAAAGLCVGALVGTAHVSASPGSSEAAEKTPERSVYGHIRSLRATGRSFELRFDPAWWLTGRTAERTKRDDTGSDDVPNDYYIVEERATSTRARRSRSTSSTSRERNVQLWGSDAGSSAAGSQS